LISKPTLISFIVGVFHIYFSLKVKLVSILLLGTHRNPIRTTQLRRILEMQNYRLHLLF